VRKLPPLSTWLAIAALIALALTLFAPWTGWIARQQWHCVLTGSETPATCLLTSPTGVALAYQVVADDHPTDIQLQIANASSIHPYDEQPGSPVAHASVTVDALNALIPRFGHDPSLFANKLRYETEFLAPDYPESDSSIPSPSITINPNAPSEATQDIVSDASVGERLDPTNAFFPLMEALGRFAEGRNNAAIKLVEKAAIDRRFDEYLSDEQLGDWRLQELAFGDKSSLSRALSAFGVLTPEYARLRSAADMAVVQAMKREQTGDYAGGIRIRCALMRCGALMRASSGLAVTSFYGISIELASTRRPGGGPAGANDNKSGWLEEEQREAFAAHREDLYSRLLVQHGDVAEAEWMRKEISAGVSDQRLRVALAYGNLIITEARLVGLWLASLLLVGAALSALLLALTGAVSNKWAGFQSPENRTSSISRSVATGILATAAVNVILSVVYLSSVGGGTSTDELTFAILSLFGVVGAEFGKRTLIALFAVLAPPLRLRDRADSRTGITHRDELCRARCARSIRVRRDHCWC